MQRREHLRADLSIGIFYQIMFVDWRFAFLHIAEDLRNSRADGRSFQSEDSSSQWALTL